VFKAVIFSFLAGVLVTGLGWFFMGRSDIGQIRADFNGVNGDFQGVQRNSDQLRIDSDGFAGDITIITETSRRIADRSGTIDEGLTAVNGDVGLITAKVDELEQYNNRLIHIGRDVGDLAFDLRQLDKESGTEE